MTDHSDNEIDAGTLARGGNGLLAQTTVDDRAFLAGGCRRVRPRRGETLTEADAPIAEAHFPERGVVSIIKQDGRGKRTEIGLIGPESFAGAAIVTADGRWPYSSFVQSETAVTIAVPAAHLRAAMARSPALRDMLVRAAHVLTIQIAEAAVSAAWQVLNARLARWLLMYGDRLRSDRIEVTHEFIALMLGAQRPGITLALHELEGEGAVGTARGLVMLRDRALLERIADGGYGIAEREGGRLLAGN